MTLQSMLEQIQQIHPKTSYTQLKVDINNSIREFSEKTKLPYAEASLTRATSYVSFDDIRNEYLWTLPSDCYEVRKVDGNYYSEIRLLNGSLYLSFQDDIFTSQGIRIEYAKVPGAVIDLSDVSDIPNMFHNAIVARVIEKYFAIAGNPQGAQYFRDIWNTGIREGLRFYNIRQWRNASLIETGAGSVGGGNSGVGNRIIAGRVSLVPGINTVNVGAPGATITLQASTYVLTINGNGVLVNGVNPDTGLTERTTSSFNVWSANSTDNFEYTIVGH